MIKPRRIGHATFETQDLDKQIAYWTEVAGLVLAEREKNRAFLATKTGLLVIQLEKTDQASCNRLSFEVKPMGDRSRHAGPALRRSRRRSAPRRSGGCRCCSPRNETG